MRVRFVTNFAWKYLRSFCCDLLPNSAHLREKWNFWPEMSKKICALGWPLLRRADHFIFSRHWTKYLWYRKENVCKLQSENSGENSSSWRRRIQHCIHLGVLLSSWALIRFALVYIWRQEVILHTLHLQTFTSELHISYSNHLFDGSNALFSAFWILVSLGR